MEVKTELLTAEAFAYRYDGRSYELVKGIPQPLSPTGGKHALITSEIVIELGIYNRKKQIGHV